MKKIKNKKIQKIVLITSTLSVNFYLAAIQISADDAGDKMKNVITNAGTETKNLFNLIGGTISGLIAGICGIAALFIVGKAGWKAWTNRGVEGVFEESGAAIGVLAIIAIIAGLISAAFFNA